MAIIKELLGVIPEASQTPSSLVAFVAVVAVALILGLRSHRLTSLRKSLKDLPEGDRRALLEAEIGQPLPPGMNAAQWLKFQRQKYLFLGFLCALAFTILMAIVIIGGKDPVIPPNPIVNDREAVKGVAEKALTHLYDTEADNEHFDLWMDHFKALYGSLSNFRAVLNKTRAQLIEPPVQRRTISIGSTATEAVAIFDAETESGMTWRERVELHKDKDKWKVSGLYVVPAEWTKIDQNPAPGSLSAFVDEAKEGGELQGAIPLPGWSVRTAGAPTTTANSTTCNVPIASGNRNAMMRDVYGGCSLAANKKLMVWGLASVDGEDVALTNVRFFPQ